MRRKATRKKKKWTWVLPLLLAAAIILFATTTRNRAGWILYLFLIQTIIILFTVQGMRFVCRKDSSVFAWKVEDRPKHWRAIDIASKILITAALAFLLITQTIPFVRDLPLLLTGTEPHANVVVTSGYDYRKDRGAVLPPSVRVRDEDSGAEFEVYLFHGEIAAGTHVEIAYLPHAKHALVVQK